ncbi:MAG: diacylglycerol/lipid kinase family protein, partial [Oscillospiraceae bacterium]
AGKGTVKSNLCDMIDVFTKHGYDVMAYPTQAVMDGYEKVKADANEYDMVIASGGDGTLSEVVNGLMETGFDKSLGYIPAGSTNDFASSLEIPKNMTSAAEEVMNGVDFHIDIGQFNSEYFVYVAAFGAFTDVSYETPQNIKNVLGHAAYIVEGIKRLPKITSYHMKVEHDDEVLEGDFILGMVTNTMSVGGMRKLITNGVYFDDGMYEVTLVKKPNNLIDLQKTINGALLSNLEKENCFVTFKTSRVKFTSEEEIAWTLDGEAGGIHKEVMIINHEKALGLRLTPDEKTEEQNLIEKNISGGKQI